MTLSLNSPLLFFAFSPLPFFAQVTAGDHAGVIHTMAGQELHTSNGTVFHFGSDTTFIDLDGDGVRDIEFTCTSGLMFDYRGSSAHAQLLHAGLALAMEAPVGYAAERLDAGDIIDDDLAWRSFETTPGLSIAAYAYSMGNLSVLGENAWLPSATDAVTGYLGVRITEGAETRYGWIGIASYVALDTAWLRIEDFGIQDAATHLEEGLYEHLVLAHLTPDGKVLLQGRMDQVERITLHDASGRMLRDDSVPVPCTIDISGEARGVYVLRLLGSAGMRALKLAW